MIHDTPSEDSSNIVDCDILEAAKENVQPLAAGRRVTALSSILVTPHSLRESRLASTRNKLRMAVQMALDDPDNESDALEAYCNLIYWTLENYPEGNSVESGLLELLEEATRVLKDHRDGCWRGELKYLKLWLLYAGYVEKPTIIYRFLIANDIGSDFGLLYEEFSAVLEREGRRREADEMYALGIARRASPLDHLKARHADFQKRMMTSSSIVSTATPASSLSTPKRTVLATTGGAEATLASSSRPAATARPNAPMSVFIDPTGSDAGPGAGNAWADLGTRKTRIKENEPKVEKVAGSKLKQPGKSKRAAAASSAAFVPYVDSAVEEESTDMPSPAASTPKAGSSSTGRGKATAGTSSKGGFAIFVDDGPSNAAESSSKSKPTKSTAASTTAKKGGFLPFVDEAPTKTSASASEAKLPPSTPKFVPFKDETATATVTSMPSSESVMKNKSSIDPRVPSISSEAEALKKNPLKNYGDDERGKGLDD